MRKIHLLLTMLMLMAFSVGTMWADDLTVDFESATSSYSDWTFVNFLTQQTNSNVQAHGGSYFGTTGAKATGSLQTVNKIANPTSITFYYSKTSTNTTASSWSVEVSEDGANWTQVGATNSASSGVTRGTWYEMTRDLSDYSNVYVRIYYNGTTAVRCLDDVVLSYTSGSSSTTPSISIKQKGSAVTSVNFGEVASYTETENQGYVVCQSVDIKASNLNGDVYLEVENSGGDYFSIYDPRYAVTSWDKFTIKPTAGAIDTTIVLKAATWMSAGTKTGKLKVSSKASTADFTALNIDLSVTVFDPAEGDYDISLNNTFFGLSATGANPDEQTGSQDGITLIAGCTSTAQNKTYYDAAHVRFYGDSYLQICAPYGFVVDAVTFTAGGTWNGGISADAGDYDADKKEWTGSSSCVTFSFTAQDRISKATVSIIKAPTVGLPTISGQTPFYPSTTVTMSIETDGADIIYTMNGEDPLGGDNTYSQPLVLTETKTIKARGFKGVELGDVVTKVFTKATPISVTDAIELIPNENDTKDDAFVYGYVCTLSESDPNANGQMTYYISKDGTETNRLQIYKGKGLNNADFSAISDIALGDKVVVYGQLKNYNGTYEMNSGNYIVERTAKGAVTSLDLTGTNTKTEFEYGDHFDPATDGSYTAKAIYANGYSEDVTSLVTWDIDGKTLEQKEIQGSGSCALTATYSGKSDWVYINISKILKHKITFAQPDHGTLVVKWLDSAIESPYETYKTYEFKVIATPAAGYELATLTANGVDIKDTKAFVMGTEDIVVAATFSKAAEGKLTLSKNVVDFGASKVGSSIASQSFKLSGTGFTPNGTISLAFAGDNKDYFGLVSDSYTADANGAISEKNVEILVNETAYATYGVRDCQLKISSDDLASDSIVTIKLTVGGVVSTTPSPVALDLGDVLNNDEPTLYGKTFHVKVTNLSANKQARVVPSTGSFYADPYYLTADGNGVIDRDVTILPYLNGGGVAVYNADLEVVCTGTREFKDIKVGTVTMNLLEAYSVIVPTISNGSLSWDGGAAPKAARPGTTHTLVAVPASGYEGGTIQILKNSDDSDITEFVLSGSTLTMPSYAIKIVVNGFKQSAKPAAPISWYSNAKVTKTYGASEWLNPFTWRTLTNNENLEVTVTSSNTNVIEAMQKDDYGHWYPVAVKAAGTTTITATFAGNDTYKATSVSYELEIVKGNAPLYWNKENGSGTIRNKTGNNFAQLSNMLNLPVTYSSSNTAIASIDASTGAITMHKGGTVQISANLANHACYRDTAVSYNLTVNKIKLALQFGRGSIDFDESEYTIDLNETTDTWAPGNRVNSTVYGDLQEQAVLSSSDLTIATINTQFKVPVATGKGGDALITLGYATNDSVIGDTISYTLHVLAKTYEVTITAPTNGTLVVKHNNVAITSGDRFEQGAVLTVEATPNSGYMLKSITTFQLEIGTTNITDAKQFTVGTKDITVEATFQALPDAPISWSGVDAYNRAWAYMEGKNFSYPTLTNNDNLTVTYASDNTGIATINATTGVITMVSEGTTHITATFAGNGSYKQTTAQYTLFVCGITALEVGGTATKTEYKEGDTFDFTGLTATLKYNNGGSDENVTALATWTTNPATISASGTIEVSASYLGKTGKKNVDVTVAVKPAAGLAWSAESANVRYGAANTYPTLSNPNNVAVSYESTNESVATINESGSISLKANGSTTIKAIFAGNDNYLAAIVSYTLNVSAGIVTITPNYPVALDLGDVIFGDERTKYGKSFHVHIENLTAGQYNQVKVTFSGAFYCAGNEFITDNDQDGVIDADVTVIPSAYYWTLNMASVLGTQNGTIGLVCTGTRQFEDIQVGTVTMNVVAPQAYSLKNNWNGGEWDWKQMSFANGVYSLSNVVFGGSGVNWRAGDTGDGEWIAVADFLGDKIGALDTVTLVLDPAAKTITATLVGKYTIKPDGHTYSVVGAILPNGWDEKSTITEMAFSDGVYSYKLEDVTLSAGTANEYKIVQDHAWTVAYPQSGNASFSVEKTGKYDVTFTLTLPDYTYAATPVLKEELVLNKTFVVLGGFNSWEADAVEVAADAATASFVVNIATAADYEFKVKVNDAWLSNNYSYHRDFTEATGITGNLEDMTLKADAAGEYTFTWTFETNALSITFPEKTGTAIDQTEAEMRPTKIIRDNKVYILRGDKIYSIQGHLVK